MNDARKIALYTYHNGPQHSTKLKLIDRFYVRNRVNSNNFNAMTLKFSEKFDHPILHVFIFGNIFPESRGFVCYAGYKPYQRFMLQFNIYLISEGRRYCSTLWTAKQRPWLSGNILPNINTCENGSSNFSKNLKIMVLKLLGLTEFSSRNPSIYFNFVRSLGSVVMLTFFNICTNRLCVVHW